MNGTPNEVHSWLENFQNMLQTGSTTHVVDHLMNMYVAAPGTVHGAGDCLETFFKNKQAKYNFLVGSMIKRTPHFTDVRDTLRNGDNQQRLVANAFGW